MPEILVQDVTVRYGSKVALDGVSVQLRDRSVSGLVGPNGSGKSTLLRVICGVEWPTRGSARVGPEHYSASASPFLRWGAFLEGGGLHPFLTARQHLTWVARASGVVEDRVDEVASLMGLRPAIDSRIRTYSLGMRQRLGIAAALLPPELELLILDEPLNGLDRGGVDLVSEVVADRSRAGATVVLATHMLSDLSKVADRVVALDSGKIFFDGSATDFGRLAPILVRLVARIDPSGVDSLRGQLAVGGYSGLVAHYVDGHLTLESHELSGAELSLLCVQHGGLVVSLTSQDPFEAAQSSRTLGWRSAMPPSDGGED